jgi:predicted 3-demethylubiquinone-9 3-methyltransferase (glyoxalase superfamily)
MKEIDFQDMGPEAFREAIEFFADSKNEYSKEELYSAFVVVTRLYLDELISARQLENLIVNKIGEQAANEFFEISANSSETVSTGDAAIALEKDPGSVIKAQFDMLDKLSRE